MASEELEYISYVLFLYFNGVHFFKKICSLTAPPFTFTICKRLEIRIKNKTFLLYTNIICDSAVLMRLEKFLDSDK